MNPNKVKNGRWCQKCQVGKSEKLVISIFEKLTGKQFVKIKPKWLKSSKGFLMELDGFNADLNVGVEYQGTQHYNVVEKFHMTEQDLINRKIDDELKIKLCKENNVNLIVVPTLVKKIKLTQLESFIKNELVALGYSL